MGGHLENGLDVRAHVCVIRGGAGAVRGLLIMELTRHDQPRYLSLHTTEINRDHRLSPIFSNILSHSSKTKCRTVFSWRAPSLASCKRRSGTMIEENWRESRRFYPLTALMRPGVPTMMEGTSFFSSSLFAVMGNPPKKLPIFTPRNLALKRSNSWQICEQSRVLQDKRHTWPGNI